MEFQPLEINGRDSEAVRLPSYSDGGSSPLLLQEMTTTRTEFIASTAAETTTHLLSPPRSRKLVAPRPSIPLKETVNNTSSHSRILSKSPSSSALFNKALPPTPPHDGPSLPVDGGLDPSVISTASPASSQSGPYFFRSRKSSAGPQTTVALAHAALGLGLPHASTSLTRETNTIAFMPPEAPVSPRATSPSIIRRVKSSQRLQSRHTSDTHENSTSGADVMERRKRGLSFTATSFLSLMSPDTKGKGKEAAFDLTSPKLPPAPLSRKSSFWSRKKTVQSDDLVSSPSKEDSTLTIFTIPPVHQFTPFEISDFSVSLSTSDVSIVSGYTEEVAPTNSPFPHLHNSSLEIPTTPSSFTRTSQSPPASGRPSTADSSTHAKLRTPTNPPLLHRLSMGFFSASESSPTLGGRSNNSLQTSTTTRNLLSQKADSRSPIPKPSGTEETPAVYVSRLKSAVNKAEIAGILASSSDPFYFEALRIYIKQFEFHDIPLDVALRKLLMEVGLPRETQQIDRVMEAFASCYMHCNPNIFLSEDHPYILAFSLIMLHTDAFNPSNKRKMSKSDYIKNTKLPGVPTEVLDCFFDNIIFAPFIFIEDPVDLSGQSGFNDVTHTLAITTPTSALPSSNGPGSFKIGNKVDPYYLITNNLLDPLRVDVNSFVPLENPFSYEGTEGPWDERELHQTFLNAKIIQIQVPSAQRTLPPVFGANTCEQARVSGEDEFNSTAQSKWEIWDLKFTKVGLLNRKDDLLEGGKKSSNRKWKSWSVVLTGSQLLLYRDPTLATSLSQSSASGQQTQSTHAVVFRPDESFSLKDAIAVYDRSYTKYKHTMRFVLPDGRQILLQAANDKDVNSWISRINYASAFKSAGIRMRPPGLSGEDVLLTGVAAATSHLHDLQQHADLQRRKSWDSNVARDLMDMLSLPKESRPPLRRRVTMSGRTESDADVPIAPEIDGAEQFKATFDQVKADLAASSWSSLDDAPWLSQEEDTDHNVFESPLTSPGSSINDTSHIPSRSQIIQSKIRYINSKLLSSQAQYDADMRYIRNIAILTPFQKSTRARLSTAVQGVTKRINLMRLEREKLHCHRHVLACDLASEDRSWSQSKEIALRVAKETLKSRRNQTVPKMTLSMTEDVVENGGRLPGTSSQTPESTTCELFHSAQDFGPAWPSSEDATFRVSENDSPQRISLRTSVSFPLWSQSQGELRNSMNSSLNSTSGRPSSSLEQTEDVRGEGGARDSDHNTSQLEDEQAEEWNRTRCAQRVSLIHVPSNLMISKARGSTDPSRPLT